MNAVELIRKKRDGLPLTEEELHWLLCGYVDGSVPDYQMAAFLMASYFRGMSEEEMLAFTRVMINSGSVVNLSGIPGVKVDKHSTGGVGDKVSLILAPIVASCGVAVPMISGRGLGHTGGTLDKLESIPGFRTNLTSDEYRRVIRETGLFMIGQSDEIVPSDKILYALRDVTATVECVPLIVGSIMSKKLAEGIDALVLDVKTGRGAFMSTYDQALELARTLVRVGNGFGTETMAFVTDMSQPLGVTIGNWLEVVEAVECLRGERGVGDGSSDLMEITHVLAAAMLLAGKEVSSLADGIDRSRRAIEDGSAYRKFLQVVEAQGGNVSAIENLERTPLSRHVLEVRAGEGGYVTSIDALDLGLASVVLGAGRLRLNDSIDPKAGIVLKKKVGDYVEDRDVLAVFSTDRDEAVEDARERIARAFRLGPLAPARQQLILSVVDRDGVRSWQGPGRP